MVGMRKDPRVGGGVGGTCEVAKNQTQHSPRLNVLSHEYELFRMFPHEFISDVQKRFTHIFNHLFALDKVFAIGELTDKVLRCLDKKWQQKVTVIMESKDVESKSLATLFRKLQEHKMS
ncbi:hypothetical protein Lal_00031808 [Lupinus albus]|nr:hypothetical protein Lal_00031808 [Lupinus albus]